jgi:hypothetical protein
MDCGERKGALKYAVWTYLDAARVGTVHREHFQIYHVHTLQILQQL